VTWELFTPDFDYEKAPYDVRTPAGEIVRCYPNAGVLHEMGGAGRYFYPCECEVAFVGWDKYHAEYVAPPERRPGRRERQLAAKRRRRATVAQRGLALGEWVYIS